MQKNSESHSFQNLPIQFQLKSNNSAQCQQKSYKSSENQKQQEKKSEQLLSQTSTQAYKNILGEVDANCRSFPELISQLTQNGIQFQENQFHPVKSNKSDQKLKILSIDHTKHYQIVKLKVSLGPFNQIIAVYNIFTSIAFNSLQKSLQLVYSGNNTNIYHFNKRQKHYVMKQTVFTNKQSQSNNSKCNQFLVVVKQFFITKIMSILKIGPKLYSDFGFDIFLSQTGCFFFLQYCKKPKNKKFLPEDRLVLKQNLREMHLLSFLHRDIKPSNISYSPSFEKYVLIDYGISEFRTQKLGQMSFVHFGGTYAYCTEEMKKLFKNRQGGLIDLHFNDAYCLEISIKEMERGQFYMDQAKSKNLSIQNFLLQDFLQQVKLKNLLFTLNSDHKIQVGKIQQIPSQMQNAIMTFLYQIPLNEKIRKFYQNFLEEATSLSNEFQDLKQIFEGKIYFESCKGKRKFGSAQELQNIEKTQQFYQRIQNQYLLKKKRKRPQIKSLEQILFDKERLNQLSAEELKISVIEYLNFKRIEPKVPIAKKMQVCRFYIIKNKIKGQNQLQDMKVEEALELVFFQILLSMESSWILGNFQDYLRTVENYFILTTHVDLIIISQIMDVIDCIDLNWDFSVMQKVEHMLMVYLSIIFVIRSYSINLFFDKMYKIRQKVYQKVQFYRSISEQRCDKDKIELFCICFDCLYFRHDSPLKYDPIQLLQQSNLIRQGSSNSIYLLSLIQYRLLTQINKLDNIYFQKKQKEEMLLQEMYESGQISPILCHIIYIYILSDQFKILKKYINRLDSCIQLESIYINFFTTFRLFLILIDDSAEQTNQKNLLIHRLCLIINQFFEVNESNLAQFNYQCQNFNYFLQKIQQLKVPIPQQIIDIYRKICQKINQALSLYENIKKPIIFRKSQNIIYIQLLLPDIEIQYSKILKDNHLKEEFFQHRLKIEPKMRSFQKIINLDRSNFIGLDHIILLYYDIMWLKHQNSVLGNRQILKYMYQKKQLIGSFFPIQKFSQKLYICKSFSLMLYLLNEENNLDLLRQGVDFVYSIVEKKFSLQNLTYHFDYLMIKSLSRLGRFKEILNQVIDSSQFYTQHLSKSTINVISKFYYSTVSHLLSFNQGKDFYAYLKQNLDKIDLKKVPVFSVFLLFCIKPFNRLKVLQMVSRILEEMKLYNAKYFIFSRFYKEALKLKSNEFSKKKKFYLRRDVRFSSSNKRNFEEIKSYFDPQNHLQSFCGAFRENLKNKIIRVGECCEVYSPRKTPDQLNEVLHHSILDDPKRQFAQEQWEIEMW